MTTPSMYGWFHIMWLFITAAAVFLLCRFRKNAEGKNLDRILRVFALICIALEIYKQLVFSFNYEAGCVTWDFEWYAFPFQFCSTPMYIALIASFLKEGKLKNALLTYLGTFGLLAGILVMALPTNVFIGMIGINIQTMVHHGGQLAIGLYLLLCRKFSFSRSSILSASLVFIVMLAFASAMNVTAELTNLKESFNMFYIRYGKNPSLPVYDSLYPEILPYPVFLLLYIIPFVGVSWGIFELRRAFDKK